MVVAQLVTALASGALDCLPILAKLDCGCLWLAAKHMPVWQSKPAVLGPSKATMTALKGALNEV